METVFISAKISENKKNELYQTLEPLKSLIKNYCEDFETKIDLQNNLSIRITFSGKNELEKNFYNNEFNILKGSVLSLCDDVRIKVNDSLVINS